MTPPDRSKGGAMEGRMALKMSETAHALGCSRQHVYEMVKRGEITRIYVGEKSPRIPFSEIERLLAGVPA